MNACLRCAAECCAVQLCIYTTSFAVGFVHAGCFARPVVQQLRVRAPDQSQHALTQETYFQPGAHAWGHCFIIY